MKNIPYARQHINQEDVEAVVEVLKSDWLTQGPTIERFECQVAAYCGAKYAVAVTSATAALHLACLAAGLGAGDELWTSPNTFVASANCSIYCGAGIDFVDIDPHTYNLSPTAFDTKLSSAREQGKVPKVVIPVHFAGQSCEMEFFWTRARQNNIVIIEDASHSIGGSYRNTKIGSCRYSDMTVFSFHPVKIITTGEGGMILTNRKEFYDKLLLLRSHGITRNDALMEKTPDGPWYYEQQVLGWNYRMTDIQAALGVSQFVRVDEFVARRRYLAARYGELLKELPVILPWQHPDTASAYHLYVIGLELNRLKKSHTAIFEELLQRGVNVNLHYIPVHTQPYYRRLGFKPGDFPVAEEYYRKAISLPMYYGLTDEDQDYVIAVLKEVLV
ncbi:MAG: UDP-4-keto-6-deoxy-N-acetylglucosamine 4-aminotransferase [Firmicutes bacterium]|nr:UDP-4-keto-6-deoxy-N-acetylglucosamine 4-aminotransferase [Bacillota bacterium]